MSQAWVNMYLVDTGPENGKRIHKREQGMGECYDTWRYNFRSVCRILRILIAHVFFSIDLPVKSVGQLCNCGSEEEGNITSHQCRLV